MIEYLVVGLKVLGLILGGLLAIVLTLVICGLIMIFYVSHEDVAREILVNDIANSVVAKLKNTEEYESSSTEEYESSSTEE